MIGCNNPATMVDIPSNATRHLLAPRKRKRPPMPGAGRPTSFRPEYCDLVERLGSEGNSPAQIATVLRIDKATLYRWAQDFEDFATALSRAKTFEQAFWEMLGYKSLGRKVFQAQVWRTSMAARFRDDYTESRTGVDVMLTLRDAIRDAVEAKPVDARIMLESRKPAKS